MPISGAPTSAEQPPMGGAPSRAEQSSDSSLVQKVKADSSLMQRVKAVLASDPSINGARIDVAAKDGTVTLSGEVDSGTSKDHAQQVVAQVDGVKSVDNQLKTRSN
jgi:hyperosmotically inducible protein